VNEPQQPTPTLAEQVTRLYELIGGYHAINLIEVGRELGAWQAITTSPGVTSAGLADALRTDGFYTDVLCRTAFSFGLLDREGDGWRMAPHFDQILGNPDSSFYLANGPRTHLLVGEDYARYPEHFRNGTTRPYQAHDARFMAEVASSLRVLPRIFLDYVLPNLPGMRARLGAGARILDVGCGAGHALVEFAARFPKTTCVGVDIEPQSVEMARKLIRERGLADRCEARLGGVEALGEKGTFELATSFLVVHEISPPAKPAAFAAIARALRPGGAFLIFDEVYPETDEALRNMPSRFAALAQWYELTWGNRVDTRTELHALCANAGLTVSEETAFSRFHIVVATKPEA
jgi:SAM-dependent methyltransferase